MKENGNETTYSYNILNQLVSENNTVYTYDDAGNLISTEAADKTSTYVYDASNKLLRATVQAGEEVIVEEYTYNYDGSRLSKTTTNGEETSVVEYFNDNEELTNVIAETDENGNELCYYTIGDELISMEHGGSTYIYLYDGHGTIRSLINADGELTDTYDYDAFGNMLDRTGETENSYLYCGEQQDSTTGYYYLRARYMNPETGTFISMDTYQGNKADPVTLHKYLYANANPVTYNDPSGYTSATLSEQGAVLGIMGILMCSMAAQEQQALRVFHSLINAIQGALNKVASLITAISLIPFALAIGGALAITYSSALMMEVLGKVFSDPAQTVILFSLFLMSSALYFAVLSHALTNHKKYINKYAIHHIVPKKLFEAIPARMVLDVVGLPIYEKNYRYAYNKYGSEAYNLVRIKKRTHIAIHHNNLLYCSWVNGMIVPAYLATWSKGTAFCKEIIIEILEVMREEILCIDALISI